jgi:hypothetical protein
MKKLHRRLGATIVNVTQDLCCPACRRTRDHGAPPNRHANRAGRAGFIRHRPIKKAILFDAASGVAL